MGLTQQPDSVATIQQVVNFLLLRGNIGRPGAGACPVRGHSNVQGDRTMGIWEKSPDTFLDALQAEFGFDPPREHGLDAPNPVDRQGLFTSQVPQAQGTFVKDADRALIEDLLTSTESDTALDQRLRARGDRPARLAGGRLEPPRRGRGGHGRAGARRVHAAATGRGWSARPDRATRAAPGTR